ncbi:MAG: TerC family protein [Thermodesulfobacteriota bacterium]
MAFLLDPDALLALVTLTALEIVLGVDNIIFIAILSGRLPESEQAAGRTVGLALAMITRIALLFSLSVIMRLTRPLFSIWTMTISGRDLILVGGGLFLLAKSTLEIHANLEGGLSEGAASKAPAASFAGVVSQIAVLDIVFSLDSVITAIGLANRVSIMALAIILAVGVMMFLSGPIARFVEHHPTIKILALSFLMLIGVSLIAEGLSLHIPKGYLYFAMAFSAFVEALNMRLRRKTDRGAPLH